MSRKIGRIAVPSEDDLIQLEEMAGRIVESLGRNLDIPETEKRRILELLNIKVLIAPDGQIKLTGFFCPPANGLMPQTSWRIISQRSAIVTG